MTVSPTTPFEDLITAETEPTNTDWTSLDAELTFLDALVGPRLNHFVYDMSEQGRPIRLVRVGNPAPTTTTTSPVLVVGTQHGDEPAGREAMFRLMRTLVQTEDPALETYLSNVTWLFVPTSNPDGFHSQARNNANNIDSNRDHFIFETKTTTTLHRIIRDYEPTLIIDLHESLDIVNDIEFNWTANQRAPLSIRNSGQQLVETILQPAIVAEARTTGIYGIGTFRATLVNSGGLRYSVSALFESSRSLMPKHRMESNDISLAAALDWHVLNHGALETQRNTAITDKIAEGESRSIYILPGSNEVLSPAPVGYRLTMAQRVEADDNFSICDLESYVRGSTVITPMAQAGQPVIPYSFDGGSEFAVISAARLSELPVASLVAPGGATPSLSVGGFLTAAPTPPPPVHPGATFSTDFSEYAVDSTPSDWTARWVTTDVSYLVKEVVGALGGKVLRLDKTVNAKRLISWDVVGTPSSVEVLTKTRNTDLSAISMYTRTRASGAVGVENSHDASHSFTQNELRLSRYLNGPFSIIHRSDHNLGVSDFAAEWLWVRMQVNESNVIRIKAWLDGWEEPTSWLTDQTIATGIAAEGWVGVGTFSGAHECDYFAVGLDGATAPSPNNS